MGADNVPVVCRGCQRTVRMDQVKFDDSRKAYVCSACYAASHSTPGMVRKKSSADVEEEEAMIGRKKDDSGKIKYNCPKCKYNFTRMKDKVVGSCPYCGYSRVEVASKGASKIITESETYDF